MYVVCENLLFIMPLPIRRPPPQLCYSQNETGNRGIHKDIQIISKSATAPADPEHRNGTERCHFLSYVCEVNVSIFIPRRDPPTAG